MALPSYSGHGALRYAEAARLAAIEAVAARLEPAMLDAAVADARGGSRGEASSSPEARTEAQPEVRAMVEPA